MTPDFPDIPDSKASRIDDLPSSPKIKHNKKTAARCSFLMKIIIFFL